MGGASGEIACPRCGYDLRTGPALWTDRCPYAGRCVECGLDFEWADLLSSKRVLPRWYVEAGPWWRLPLAVAATAIVAFWPPLLWRRVRLAHRVRWWRLAIMPAALLLACVAFAALAQGWLAWRISSPANGSVIISDQQRLAYVGRCVTIPWDVFGVPVQVRTRVPVFDEENRITLQARTIWTSLPSSRELVEIIVDSQRRRVGGAMFMVSVMVLMPVLLVVLLPVSRRLVRVRTAHIARSAALGLVPPAAILLVLTVPSILQEDDIYGGLARAESVPVPLNATIVILLLAWWWAAVRLYMRLPHAAAVVASLGAIAMLLAYGLKTWWELSVGLV